LDTQKRTKDRGHFIILIPHRDSLKPLEEYRRRLFTAGFCGAYSFPMVAPLARVSRPFSREELKELARNIRKLPPQGSEGAKSADEKIKSAGTGLAAFPGNLTFFGPLLDLPLKESLFPQTSKDKILHVLSSPVLCAAIVSSHMNAGGETQIPEEAPALSFRAASLANLAIRPLAAGDSDYSFEWRIGPPAWLPKHKGNNE